MFFLIVPLAVILVLLTWILSIPLVLRIDTHRDILEVRQALTFLFKLAPERNYLPELYIGGMKVNLQGGSKNKKKKIDQPKAPGKGHRTPNIQFLMRAVSCIHVRAFFVNVDTGNVVDNAKLIPVALLVSRGPVDLKVNYDGIVSAYIVIVVVPFEILFKYIVFKLNS